MPRNWCFTDNNPILTADEMVSTFRTDKRVRYLVFQLEQGEEETPHFQGYVEFNACVKLGGVKKFLPRAHWETRKGSRESAKVYCQKDDTRKDGPWEYGIFSEDQGKRNDIEALYDLAKSGKSLSEIADAHPSAYMRYHRAVQLVRQLPALDKPVRTIDLTVWLLHGPTDSGKTRYVYNTTPDVYSSPLSKDLWFDNYRGEKDILIDDFAGNMSLTNVLRLFDRYPIQVPVKGGFVYWCPDNIYITSNVHPSDWYDYSKRTSSFRALSCRFHKILLFSKDKEPKDLNAEEIKEFFEIPPTRFFNKK